MIEPWIPWALGEAAVRTTSGVFMKSIGLTMETLLDTFLVLFVIGVVQVLGGLLIVLMRKRQLKISRALIGWSILFGINGFVASVLVFLAFAWGGDLGMVAFISALSIIPGALIDRIFFNHRLQLMGWLGIAVGLFGMYVILDFPDLGALAQLPRWVLVSLAAMLLLAINQAATQASKEIDSSVKNVWAGGATLLLSAVGFAFLNSGRIAIPWRAWSGGALLGLLTIILVFVNLMSYKTGARIAAQKLVVRGSHIVFSMVVGIFLFHEPAGFNKLLGVFTYLIALALMQTSKQKGVDTT